MIPEAGTNKVGSAVSSHDVILYDLSHHVCFYCFCAGSSGPTKEEPAVDLETCRSVLG